MMRKNRKKGSFGGNLKNFFHKKFSDFAAANKKNKNGCNASNGGDAAFGKEKKCFAKYSKQDKASFFVKAGGCLCIMLVCASVFLLMLANYNKADTQASYNFVVVLDAGHGGIDGGVVGVNTKVKESTLNLQMTYILKELFTTAGFPVVLTRTDDNGLYGDATDGFKRRDMQKRKEIILQAKANMVISVHMNKFSSPSRSGPQVFFEESSEAGKLFAQKMQAVLNDFTGNKHSALAGDYFMLKCTESPSIIVECGFLSNAEDERKLINKDYQRQLAEKIFNGALLYISGSGMSGANRIS